MHWGDDMYLVNPMIVKSIEKFKENDFEEQPLISLYKDDEDDKLFVKELFRQTVIQEKENKKLIAGKTKNWEVERIAMMDVLLMQMLNC